MVNKSIASVLSTVILILFFFTGCTTTPHKGSAVGPGSNARHGGKTSSIPDDGSRLNIGVEIFTVSPAIITSVKKETDKIDNSGASNTSIQEQLNVGNNSTQNQPVLEGKKIKVPLSTASKVLRDTESAFLAVRLKQLLDETRKYGIVNVIPTSNVNGNKGITSTTVFDYVISTDILKSDGNRAEFNAEYLSSIDGFKNPSRFTVSKEILRSAYIGKKNPATGVSVLKGDPYDEALNEIVEDFGNRIEKNKTKYPVKKHQELTLARYGNEVAPDIFKDYPIKKRKGKYAVNPAPNPANPLVSNVIKGHKTELMAIDAFEKHYKDAARDVELPYILWRRETQEALVAYEDFKRERRKVKVRGGLMIGGKKLLVVLSQFAGSGGEVSGKSVAMASLITFIMELGSSMVDSDGNITVVKFPNFETYFKNNRMYEFSDLLEEYNEQLIGQADAVESLKKEFTTLSEPIILETMTSSKTYYGKLDEIFIQYKEDLRKDYAENTGFAPTAQINNKSVITKDKIPATQRNNKSAKITNKKQGNQISNTPVKTTSTAKKRESQIINKPVKTTNKRRETQILNGVQNNWSSDSEVEDNSAENLLINNPFLN